MQGLMEDECIIGKVPALEEPEIDTLFTHWEVTEEKPCKWEKFRENLNSWLWKLQKREKL